MPVQAPPAEPIDLSAEERRRYARHLTLPEFGLEGQQKLKEASVLLVGVGGLGSPLALYLAAAGVGRLGLVDFDVVDVSNLQRQVLYGTAWLGQDKLEAARARIHDLNPHVQVDLHETPLTRANALDLVGAYDVVADGTDNFPTRYLVNDTCTLTSTPNVHGSIYRFEGQVSVFCTPAGPSYRCLYPEPPPPHLVPSCAEGGVLGVLPGIVGTLQATEVLKLIAGIGEPLIGRLLLIDALTMQFRTLRIPRDPDWPAGAPHPTVRGLVDYERFCGISPPEAGAGTPGDPLRDEHGVPALSVHELRARLDAGERPFMLDVRQPGEYAAGNLGGTLISVGELEERLDEIAEHRGGEVVVHCRSGARSARAVALLRRRGFTGAVILVGGLLAWRDEIDLSLPVA